MIVPHDRVLGIRRAAAACNQAYQHPQRRRLGTLRLRPVVSSEEVPTCKSPFDWYIADDLTDNVRHVVVRGSSYGFSHWKSNFECQPHSWFEDCVVHTGTWKNAMQLLSGVANYVCEDREFQFSGHSAGGNISMVCAMEMVRLGLLGADQVRSIYTFGSPSVVAGGPLPLRPDAVCNVAMNYDAIVRAFSCDYSMIPSAFLKLGKYDFFGGLYVIQPRPEWMYTQGHSFHPCLPRAYGVFHLRDDHTRTLFLTKPHPVESVRNIGAMIDYHAMPSYSRCASRLKSATLVSTAPEDGRGI